MKDKQVSEREFQEWVDNPVTLAFFSTLLNWKEELKNHWVSGSFTDQSEFGMALLNAKAIGTCQLIDHIVNFEYDELVESE